MRPGHSAAGHRRALARAGRPERAPPAGEPPDRVVRNRRAGRGSGVRAGARSRPERRCRGASSASTSPPTRGATPSGRWSGSRRGARRRRSTGSSRSRGSAQQDDFAAIHEVVTRYLTRRRDEGKPLPDLVVIDGGKGQLGAARAAADAARLRRAAASCRSPSARRRSSSPGAARALRLAAARARRSGSCSARATRPTASAWPTAGSGGPHAPSPPSCSTFPGVGPLKRTARCSSASAASPAVKTANPGGDRRRAGILLTPRRADSRRAPKSPHDATKLEAPRGHGLDPGVLRLRRDPRRRRPADGLRLRTARGWSAIRIARPGIVQRAEVRRRHGMWRFRAFLPIRPGEEPVSLGEGDTPLLKLARHGDAARRAASLRQGRGHQSDRLLQGARAERRDDPRHARRARDRFTLPTAGNAGVAASAYAARAGAEVRVFAPDTTPPTILSQIRAFGGDLVLIRRTHRRLRQGEPGLGGGVGRGGPLHPAGALPDRGEEDPGTRAGAPAGVEDARCHHLPHRGRHRPDRDVEGLPRAEGARVGRGRPAADVYSVQSSGCAPIVKAFEAGADRARAVARSPDRRERPPGARPRWATG